MGTCTFHPDNTVEGICLRCNSGICRDCICEFNARPYCTRCILAVKQHHSVRKQSIVWLITVTILSGTFIGWAIAGLSGLPDKSKSADAGSQAKDAGPPSDSLASLKLPGPKQPQGKLPPPLPPELKRKLEAHRKGCEQDRAVDCFQFAKLVSRSPEPLRFQLAIRALQQACRLKYGKGCAGLAQLYHQGIAMKRNYSLAAQLSKRACELGELSGCAHLGALHADGLGVKKDGKKAIGLFQKACKGGQSVACHHLGIAWLRGVSGKKNTSRARRAFTTACKRKVGRACYRLGEMYKKGIGGRANAKQSKRWLLRACQLGINEACR